MQKIKSAIQFLLKQILRFTKWILRLINKLFLKINSKKRYAIPFYLVVAYVLLVVLLIQFSGDSSYDKTVVNKRIENVTQLHTVQVAQVVVPKNESEIIQAIKSTSGPISVGGGRFSMGGQVAFDNSLHIDMRQFNKVLELNPKTKQVRVQAGITWRQLQEVIDSVDLSIKIMQTYANFTVGGSVSVNCHGRYIGHGPIISSVKELKLITANGDVIIANRNQNADLFKAAVGGYGGIGVISEVTLQLVDNTKVKRHAHRVDVADYVTFFKDSIRNNPNVIFQNGDLYPPHYEVVNNISWTTTDDELTDGTRIRPDDDTYWLEPKLVELVSYGDFGKWLHKAVLDPIVYSSKKVVWRNNEASYDVAELEPKSREEQTYVLQEYFIPVDHFDSFVPKMKAVNDEYNVNVINVSIRHARPDHESYLSWAEKEVFAFVIYYKQKTDQASQEKVKAWTVAMTDAILSEEGTWYLPYQPHASVAQFNQGYPNANKYFEVKNQVDSLQRFNNKLLDKYNPALQHHLSHQREQIEGYFRREEQAYLTVPEWYLVFNPKVYADYLESGNNPSDFPFYASIDEYWKLYDRSVKLVSEAYPHNGEYLTMLQVIGVSVTMEYALKMIYENTIGTVFSWFSDGTLSEQEKTINEAQRAYSDFIYHTAWYEFEFLPWIGKVWQADDQTESSWFRKWERTFLFTFEYAVKAGYAQLIQWGAKSSYEEPVTEIYLMATVHDSIPSIQDVTVVANDSSQAILSITRWGPFTEAIKSLSEWDIEIHEIGGNDEIVVSVLLPKDAQLTHDDVVLLYNSEVVTDNSINRGVYQLPVHQLLPFVKQVKQKGFELEHVFDY